MRQHTTAAWLALAFAALIVYASLYPFEGWRWPPGYTLARWLQLPWPRVRLPFDESANLLGYLPLGALIYGAWVRSGRTRRGALLFALGLPVLLSYTLEVTQGLLPQRVPSAKDWALNSAGAALGVALAAALHAAGWLDRWQRLRERWFVRQSAPALVLLLLWPVGLLFPAPLPLGMGQIGDELRVWIEAALAGTPWEDTAVAWLQPNDPSALALAPAVEALAIALGVMAPCLVAFAATHGPRWHRLLLVPGALVLAVAVTALSTALNFGPQNAFTWLTPASLPGLALGLVGALACAPLGRRMAAAVGLVVLTAGVALVSQAPSDPYYAASLQAWEQGRFVRFHGVARWIGWLWPYAAMAWLLWRLGARDDAPR